MSIKKNEFQTLLDDINERIEHYTKMYKIFDEFFKENDFSDDSIKNLYEKMLFQNNGLEYFKSRLSPKILDTFKKVIFNFQEQADRYKSSIDRFDKI